MPEADVPYVSIDHRQAGEDASKIGVLPPLAGPHGDKGTIAWVNNIMVYEQTKDPEAVKTFLKGWSKNQKLLFVQGKSSQIPARGPTGLLPKVMA